MAQIKCADIRTDNQFFYFDLRPFDARSGRVALQDLRNLKTNAAGRVIPVHPLLIELGLLERMPQPLAGLGRRDATRGPVQKPHAQPLLQSLDDLAQGRLADREPRRRTGKTAFSRYRQEGK
ncbi:hypothetical protein ACVWW4_002858 [Bradyrhizobium sp. LB7.1]